ncbi:a1-alpha2 repression [Perkinsus olseni]|uniref:A1-alpha2 repression n=1 Tax=Perkinsus olseni TaxID=32597 RepID=A0A7J6MB49_PEROL|nr:a1-alpha2 repression [Perkinsus olseni]
MCFCDPALFEFKCGQYVSSVRRFRLSFHAQAFSQGVGQCGQSSSLGAASPHRDSTRSEKHSGVDGFMGFLKSTLGRQRRSQQASSARRGISDHDEDGEATSTSLTASPGYSEFSHVQDAEDILAPISAGGAAAACDDDDEDAECFESQMEEKQKTPLGPDARTCSLLMEYRHLQDNAPRGLYVCPDVQDLLIWHCVLILRQGHYKGAILKFVLRIPEDYPNSAPTVQFSSRVYHPLVDEATGILDISLAFPTWEPGRDYAVLVLAFVKKVFYRSDLIGWRGGEDWIPNPGASKAFNLAFEKGDNTFQREVDKCIMESQREVFLPPSPGCSLTFKEYNDSPASAHSMISAALRNMPEELAGPQRTQAFCDWLTDRFIPRCEAQRRQEDQPAIKQLWDGPEDDRRTERCPPESESPVSAGSPSKSGNYRQRKKDAASETANTSSAHPVLMSSDPEEIPSNPSQDWLVKNGGVLLVLEFPVGSYFGIDKHVWQVGPRFMGVHLIPYGVHYVFYSEEEMSPRTGFFVFFGPNRPRIQVRRWQPETVELMAVGPQDTSKYAFMFENQRMFADQLGPYPQEGLAQWKENTLFITPEVIAKLQPVNAGRLIKSSEAPGAEKEAEGETPVVFWTDIPRFTSKRLTGAQLTAAAIDRSEVLIEVLTALRRPTDLLGELQAAFVVFVLGQSFEAFEQWKALLGLFAESEGAIDGNVDLFNSLYRVLFTQLQQMPDDMLLLDDGSSSFVVHHFRRIVENGSARPSLAKRAAYLKKLCENRFGESCGDVVEVEEGEDPPVVVDTDAQYYL